MHSVFLLLSGNNDESDESEPKRLEKQNNGLKDTINLCRAQRNYRVR